MKFDMKKACGGSKVAETTAKRPAEEVATTQNNRSKVAKISDIVVEEDGPKPKTPNTKKLSFNAPVRSSVELWDNYNACAIVP